MPFKKGGKPWNNGKPASEESKKKMSIAQKKRYAEGAAPWNKGKKGVQGWSEERKNRMSKRMTGKKNPMHGKRITGSKHHMYGKHPTEDTRRRISEGG